MPARMDIPEELHDIIIEEYSDGATFPFIQKKYKCSYGGIKRLFNDRNVIIRNQGPSVYVDKITQQKIIDLYDEGKGESVSSIIKITKIGRDIINKILEKKGVLQETYKHLTQDDKDQITAEFAAGLTVQEIEDKLNFGHTTISAYLDKSGIKPKIIFKNNIIDESVLNSIDTEEKAYFLGYIWNFDFNKIIIRLPHNISYLLERFEKLLINKEQITDKIVYKGENDIHLSLEKCSNIKEKLKSIRDNFPNCVPNNLIRHFIRGYFDHKGSVNSCKKEGFITHIGFHTSKVDEKSKNMKLDFLNWLKNTIENYFKEQDIRVYCALYGEKSGYGVYLRIANTYEGCDFLNWIYNDSSIKIEEKYQKFLDNIPTKLYNDFKNSPLQEPSKQLPESKVKRIIVKRIQRKLADNRIYLLEAEIFAQLPYSIETVCKHLESQWKPWMNWANHTVYRARDWKDDDDSTWSWHIDHEIPHSDFDYKSLDDPQFLECWALSNLRPYPAKPNIVEGSKRTRHTTPRKNAKKNNDK